MHLHKSMFYLLTLISVSRECNVVHDKDWQFMALMQSMVTTANVGLMTASDI